MKEAMNVSAKGVSSKGSKGTAGEASAQSPHLSKIKRTKLMRLFVVIVLVVNFFLRKVTIVSASSFDFKVALMAICFGVFLRGWSAGILVKREVLATGGPYALSRNPLYLGSFFIMLGFCIILNDVITMLAAIALFFALYSITISKEEVYLKKVYGEDWDRFVKTTPKFFPILVKRPKDIWHNKGYSWSFKQYTKNKEYNAIVGVAIGGIFLYAFSLLAR